MTRKPFTLWAGVLLLVFQVGYAFLNQFPMEQQVKAKVPENSEIAKLLAADPNPKMKQSLVALRTDLNAINANLSTAQASILNLVMENEAQKRITTLDISRVWRQMDVWDDKEITSHQVVAKTDRRLELLSLAKEYSRLHLDFSKAAQCDKDYASLGIVDQSGKLVITVQKDAIQSAKITSNTSDMKKKSLLFYAHRVLPNLFEGGVWHTQQNSLIAASQFSLDNPADLGMLIEYKFDHQPEDGPRFEPRINLFIKDSGLGIAKPVEAIAVTRLMTVGEDGATAYAFFSAEAIATALQKSEKFGQPIEELSVIELVSFHHPAFRLSGIYSSPAMVPSAESSNLDKKMPALSLGARVETLSVLLDTSNPHTKRPIAILNPEGEPPCIPDYSFQTKQYRLASDIIVSITVSLKFQEKKIYQFIMPLGAALLSLYLMLSVDGSFRKTLYSRLYLARLIPQLISFGLAALCAAYLLTLFITQPDKNQSLITPILFLMIMGLREFVTSSRSNGGKPIDASIADFDQAAFLLACTAMLGLLACGLMFLANVAGWSLIVLLGIVMLSRLDAYVEAKR